MPHLRPIGGIFWRLDANGNLTAYDSSGSTIAKFLGGKLSLNSNKSVMVTNTPITSTTSLSYVTLGVSLQITPQVSTSIFLYWAMLSVSNNTASVGTGIALFRSTGSNNPAGGAVPDGVNATGEGMVNNASTAGFSIALSGSTLDTGLTVGQAYTYEFCGIANGGGTASWSVTGASIRCGAFEL